MGSPTMESLDGIVLKGGGHATRDEGMCVMEAVAWFANEPHSAAPQCTCAPLTRYGIGINDAMPGRIRQNLKPLIPLLVGARDDSKLVPRGFYFADRAVRVIAPLALRKIGLEAEAAKLEALPPIVDIETANAARSAADAASSAAIAASSAANAARYAAIAASSAANAARYAAIAARSAANAARYAAIAASSTADAASYAAIAASSAAIAARYAADAASYAAIAASSTADAARSAADEVWTVAIDVFRNGIALAAA